MDVLMTDKWLVKLFYADKKNKRQKNQPVSLRLL
jgi:hypothetical protein